MTCSHTTGQDRLYTRQWAIIYLGLRNSSLASYEADVAGFLLTGDPVGQFFWVFRIEPWSYGERPNPPDEKHTTEKGQEACCCWPYRLGTRCFRDNLLGMGYSVRYDILCIGDYVHN